MDESITKNVIKTSLWILGINHCTITIKRKSLKRRILYAQYRNIAKEVANSAAIDAFLYL